MKTGYAIFMSIFIAIFILTSGLIVYIGIQEITIGTSGSKTNTQISLANTDLTSADLNTQDVTNENGEVGGQRGYVEITDDELVALSYEQLKTFADNYVKDGQFQWFSITTPNGRGIYFSGGSYEYAEYGILSEDGRTEYLFAKIALENNTYIFHNVDGSDVTLEQTVDAADTTSDKDNIFKRADYENDWFGIQFTAPKGYSMLSDRELAELNEWSEYLFSDDPSQLNYDETAIDSDSNLEMMCEAIIGTHNVNVITEELPDFFVTVDQFIEELFSADLGLSNYELKLDHAVENVIIGGKEFKKIHSNSALNLIDIISIELNQDLYIAIKGDKILMICLTYMDDEAAQAAALLNAFQAK